MNSLKDVAIDGVMQGAGSYLAVKMLNRAPNNNSQFFGRHISVAQASGITSGLIAVADNLIVKQIVQPKVPEWARGYIDSGNFVGKSVMQGAAPVAVLSLGNVKFDGIGDRVSLGVQTLVGSYVGELVGNKFVKPLVEREY